MQQRLSRWLPFVGAHPPARSAGRPVVPADDPWAGDDEPWADEDFAPESPADVLRFFRGLALGILVGAALWVLVALALVLLLG